MILLALGLHVAASEPPVELDLSSDVDWTAGQSLFADEHAVRLTLSGPVAGIALGPLPASADVIAYDQADDGRLLFVLDTPVDLGFGLVRPQDILAWDGQDFAVYLAGSAAGIPTGARIDALGHRRHNGSAQILVSFDVTVVLPGGVFAADEDIVAWNGAAWSMVFAGVVHGVPQHFDVDGYDRDLLSGTQYFSFDTSGSLPGAYFDDEDVVAFDGSTWSLVYDASANDGNTLAAGDLDALGVRLSSLFKDGFESQPALD